MQLIDGRPVYAATDLVGFLACDHRLALERAAMAGLVARPIRNDPSIELVARRGLEHERRYLEDLRASGRSIVEIEKDGSSVAPLDAGGTVARPDAGTELREAARQTLEAMRAGADVIYQATFFDGRWRGHADFLLRRDHGPGEPDSAFGPWHYEVADTKLARHVKGGAILQICSYVDLLTKVQGRQPAFLYVVLGGRERPTDRRRVEDFMAYYRRVKAAFTAAVGLPGDDLADIVHPPQGTYPEPVEHCDVCRWRPQCRDVRRRDDDLSLVAGASSRQRAALKARGVRTRRGLAATALPMEPPLEGVGAEALERVHEQARIQVEGEDAGAVLWELLPIERMEDGTPVAGRGLLGLPEPSPNDLFLDLEGDPFALEDGVDYLFGILEPGREEDGDWKDPGGAPTPAFHEIWSLDERGEVTWAAEKRAFERTIDLIIDRWERDPSLHVYHYAAYERTALGRLAQRHGTREQEVDRLLRGGVLVDLFRAVRQGIRASVESYSIKRIEPLYSLRREVDLKDAGSSIVAFETWLELGPEAPVEDGRRILREIAGYNRDDVVSNWRLRDWLEERRRDLERREREAFARPELDDGLPSTELGDRERYVLELMDRLAGTVPADPVERATDPDAAGRWLLAQLLAWHRRENKAAWWRYFELLKMNEDELIEQREPIGGLRPIGEPRREKQSFVYTLGFPPQDHRIDTDSGPTDPVTRRSAGEIVSIDNVHGLLELKRGRSFTDVPLPRALVPELVVPTNEHAESLLRIGEWVVEHGLTSPVVQPGRPDLASARRLLLRERPTPAAGPDGDLRRTAEVPLETAVRLAPLLDGVVLPVQGPPGSGKTHTGAHMIATLVADGKKVGVVANSHRVIGNLLRKTAEEAATLGIDVRIGQKPKKDRPPTYDGATPIGDNAEVVAALRDGRIDVVGAVAWTCVRAEMATPSPILDVLFVDEAGQMSLANVLACAPAARSIVLLGDPQQLDQPTQGSHPPGAERSALAHILDGRATIDAADGLFLEETWRLHPDICRFTSAAFYAGRLRSRPGLERQLVRTDRDTLFGDGPTLDGSGIRAIPVSHAGNDTDSLEEAAAVVDLVRALLDANATWTDPAGTTRPITIDDVVIVAPYNAHVAAIERAFAGAGLGEPFAGTVDKFQGQERPVSIYTMGTSTPEDAPRGMEFLYSLNRLNVATSRARCVAAVVCSPALLRVACRTPRQMELANGLCLAIEAAGIVSA
jgi:predicted RecB family nuclease